MNKTDELKYLQSKLLELYKDVAKLFKENNIEFYACDGTMIGAVREKGFIPWDDDIDLYLTRPNYNKLLKIAKKNNNKIGNFEVATAELGNSMLTFGKIFDKRYRLNAKGLIGDEDYLFIDLFILDGVPNDDNERKAFVADVVKKRKPVAASRHTVRGLYNVTKNKVLFIPKLFLKIITSIRGRKRIVKKYLDFCKSYDYDKCDYVECLTWSSVTGKDIKISKKDLKPIHFKFEDTTIPVFKGYDAYLRAYFGDYMKRPPMDKRPNHDIKIINN